MPRLILVIFAISFALCACSLTDDVKPPANYVLNYGKNDKPYYHLLFNINAHNLVKIEPLSEKKFEQNGGQFEVLLKKDGFPIKAPHCNSNIILRMPWVASQFELTQKYLLYKNIATIFHNQNGSVTVAIELNPYVKVNEDKLLLTNCNVYFRHTNNQYIPHVLNIN